MDWAEIGRAVYGFGLLLACAGALRALPTALRVVRDLTAAVNAFTIVLGRTTVPSESQQEQLELTRAIAAHLGVTSEPERRQVSPRPPPPAGEAEIGDPLP